MTAQKRQLAYNLLWNIGLCVVGALIQALAYKGIGIPQNFVPGGIFGVSSLIYYNTTWLNPGYIFLFLNLLLFVLGYFFVTRRFLYYSAFSMGLITLFYQLINVEIPITNQFYAALVFGVMLGAGGGIVLRSFGSNGGLDVIAVLLNQKFNIGIGKTYFGFNLVLFSLSFLSIDNDLVIASMIAVFATSLTVDYVLSMFNQRKLAFIISSCPDAVAEQVMSHLKIGTTMMPAIGAYRREARTVLMVVINNIQLKKLEEIVFTIDNDALFIVENTFSVLGSTFSKRKIY
jgi:uncharacterized membrane-anchored protein YitT (DUF2179 family)